MKAILLIVVSLLVFSCGHTTCRSSLDDLTNQCKGHAIVVAKGYNEGGIIGYRYMLLIKDTETNNTYEYFGAKYEVNIGDTLK